MQQTIHASLFEKLKYLALLVLVIALYFYLNLFANALTDDAFITLRYVKTLLSTGTWGFLPGYVTNAVTSPLNVFLLAFAGVLLGAMVNAVLWVSAIILALTAVLLVRISSHLFKTTIFGCLAAGALIFNPLIVSTLGLESILFIGLYVLSTHLYLTKRWSLLGAVLGLITITRFEGILFFIVTLALVPSLKLRVRFSTVYLLCVAPWYLFSWVYFGSLFPDTLFIKTAQRSWGTWEFMNGLDLYYHVYRFEIIASFLLLPSSLLLFSKRVRRVPVIRFLLLTGLVHFAGYSSLHVPPYYWYYVPELTSIILMGSLGLGILFQHGNSKISRGRKMQSVAVFLLILQASGMFYILTRDGFPLREMPIHTNWATHEQYKKIGEWLKENTDGGMILVDGEIGTLGYYCDCYLSSFFSDRRWLRQYVRQQTSGRGIKSFLYRMNFLFFDKEAAFPPPVYSLTESPSGKETSTQAIKQWETKTKWIAHCLVKLSKYSR